MSPMSGSRAYDWVEHGQKQFPDDGMTFTKWLHLRDGTRLSAILNADLGLKIMTGKHVLCLVTGFLVAKLLSAEQKDVGATK